MRKNKEKINKRLRKEQTTRDQEEPKKGARKDHEEPRNKPDRNKQILRSDHEVPMKRPRRNQENLETKKSPRTDLKKIKKIPSKEKTIKGLERVLEGT